MDRPISWLDNLKALCIFLVVVGHFPALLPVFKSLIYSIHLPAFLFVTGYLSARYLLLESPQVLIKRQIVYYIRLYALFSMVASLLWYLLEARGQNIIQISKPLIGSLLGLHGPSLNLIHNNDPLWYFPFLVTSLLAALLFVRLSVTSRLIIIALVFVSYQLQLLHPFAWSLDLAPLGALFILLGVYYSRLVNSNEFAVFEFKSAFLLFVAAISWLLLVWLNGQINLNSREFGASWIMLLLAAVSGLVLLIGMCRKIPENKLAHQLSKHTLIIFCTHIYLVKALNSPISKLSEPAQQIAILIGAIVVTAACWLLSVFTQPLLIHWFKPKSSMSLEMQKRI